MIGTIDMRLVWNNFHFFRSKTTLNKDSIFFYFVEYLPPNQSFPWGVVLQGFLRCPPSQYLLSLSPSAEILKGISNFLLTMYKHYNSVRVKLSVE